MRLMQRTTGAEAAHEYLPLLLEELAPFDEDPRAPA